MSALPLVRLNFVDKKTESSKGPVSETGRFLLFNHGSTRMDTDYRRHRYPQASQIQGLFNPMPRRTRRSPLLRKEMSMFNLGSRTGWGWTIADGLERCAAARLENEWSG